MLFLTRSILTSLLLRSWMIVGTWSSKFPVSSLSIASGKPTGVLTLLLGWEDFLMLILLFLRV
ncbi:hypothetical protein CFP56_024891 [Quercus suber]|uniref:Uncharacterized protein n=1 Tax=Quercus suber TaxID=58331 RepID=A0AAW0K6E7_QUESU